MAGMSPESFGVVGRKYRTPASENDHGSFSMGRRLFLRKAYDGLMLVSALAGGVGGYYAKKLLDYEIQKDKDRETFELLDKLIGRNSQTVGLGTVPAINHPNVRHVKQYFSESGQEVSTSYGLALNEPNSPIREAAGAIQLHKEDTAVVIGSRLANTFAEHHLGPADRSPDRCSRIKDAQGRQAHAQWTFHSDPTAAPVEIVQWGKSWLSRNNSIIDFKSGHVYTAPECLHHKTGKKYRDGDYLLLQVLPRYKADDPQRVVIFEGLHRNGTRAAGLLCSNPRIDDLRRLTRDVGNCPYYQALFRVDTRVDGYGEAHPTAVELCGHGFPLFFN